MILASRTFLTYSPTAHTRPPTNTPTPTVFSAVIAKAKPFVAPVTDSNLAYRVVKWFLPRSIICPTNSPRLTPYIADLKAIIDAVTAGRTTYHFSIPVANKSTALANTVTLALAVPLLIMASYNLAHEFCKVFKRPSKDLAFLSLASIKAPLEFSAIF